jgi:parvulin-like peptidyl-prolyl isomerase
MEISMNFKKILLAASISSIVAFSSFASTVATFKGGSVTETEIMSEFAPIFANQPELKGKKFADFDKNLRENLVRGYINSKLLEKEAIKKGLDKTEAFKTKFESVRKQLLQQELIAKITEKVATKEKIDAEYTKITNELKGKKEAKASHILVKTEKEALDVKKKLNAKGAKFSDIAKQFSEDPGSKTNGGELGYFAEGQMVPEFEKKVFSMKVGEISDPVKTDFGYHIIKLEDRRNLKVPSKEEATKMIVNKLNNEAIQKYVEDLQQAADIKLSL